MERGGAAPVGIGRNGDVIRYVRARFGGVLPGGGMLLGTGDGQACRTGRLKFFAARAASDGENENACPNFFGRRASV